MALGEYRKKRKFNITPEPTGKKIEKGQSSSSHKPSFVIQKHAASHLHYDFRLEHRGVLKSWAVPKGPSLVPQDKRLAIEVEDHPLEYGKFEGIIPEKQYGAGEVIVWDRGWWEPENSVEQGFRNGKLEFKLHGEKLHGRWALLKMRASKGKPQWLLIKANDGDARPKSEPPITETRPESVVSGKLLNSNNQIPAKISTQRKRENKGKKSFY